MATELFANQVAQTAFLLFPIAPGDTSCTLSSVTNFPAITPGSGQEFRMSIQDSAVSNIEIVLVTATAANVFTIQRGIEGSMAASHLANAACGATLTKYHVQNMFPQPPHAPVASASITIDPSDQIILINQAEALTVNIDPTILIRGKIYTVKDGGYNSATYPITLTPTSGQIDNAANYSIQINGQSIGFFTDGTNLYLVN